MVNHSDISKNFIPYELAVKLKKLGLKIKCPFGYYCEETYEIHDTESTRMTLSKYKFGHIDKIMTAPLWQQAFDWFRVTHQLSGEVYKQYPHANKYYDWCYAIPLSYDRGYDVEGYKTYEEARLECLKELIKIIEDEKI